MKNSYPLKSSNPRISILGLLVFILLNTPLTVSAQADWNDPGPMILRDAGDSFFNSSLLEIEGRPAIAYSEVNSNYIVRFMRGNDATGSSFGSAVTVDGTFFTGIYSIDMAVINGNPAITSTNGTAHDIRYTRAFNSTGDFWNTTVVVAPNVSTSAILYIDLEEVNGKPAIAYYDSDDGDLYYVGATDADGTTWGTPILIASTGNVGQYLSLSVIDGQPAISYYDATNQDLMYIRANNADGTTWGTPITVWSNGNVGRYTSLTTVNGRPAIAFNDISNSRLLYMRALNSTGSSWSFPTIITTQGAEEINLLVVDGQPAVGYYAQNGANDLRYVYSQDIDGTAWDTPQVLDDGSAAMGNLISMAIINGNPAISYQDFTNSDLKYIRATYTNGLPLPVTLTFFTGKMTQQDVHLTWQTESETNNEGFEVQRSTNGRNWEAIGFVEGHGTTIEKQNYDYSDHKIPNTDVYYRLKQIDYDGKYEYSNIIIITQNEANQTTVKIYPTIVNNELNITGGKGKLTIYNSFGKQIFPYTQYESKKTIALGHLPPGSYFLQILDEYGNGIKTEKFIKVN